MSTYLFTYMKSSISKSTDLPDHYKNLLKIEQWHPTTIFKDKDLYGKLFQKKYKIYFLK